MAKRGMPARNLSSTPQPGAGGKPMPPGPKPRTSRSGQSPSGGPIKRPR